MVNHDFSPPFGVICFCIFPSIFSKSKKMVVKRLGFLQCPRGHFERCFHSVETFRVNIGTSLSDPFKVAPAVRNGVIALINGLITGELGLWPLNLLFKIPVNVSFFGGFNIVNPQTKPIKIHLPLICQLFTYFLSTTTCFLLSCILPWDYSSP